MTTPDTQPVTVLSDKDSWWRLSSVTLGRLATTAAGHPEIFPVNFVVQRHTVLIRTAEGTKLLSALLNPSVAFEADEHNAAEGWSVVVKGQAHVLNGAEEIAEAERAHVLPWIATVKLRYIRIVPTEITGRSFQFGSEPEPWVDPS